MNTGKALFAQLMDFLPWTTFTRIVDRYGGDHRVRTLSCAEQYRSMAFAQLTYRESLRRHRDLPLGPRIETLSHGLPPAGPALDAGRCQRKARLAYPCGVGPALITQARTLYVDEELGLDLTNTVYALDSTTIALCLSVFPWAHFRTTKAAEDAHAARPAGQHSEFYPISDGKLHDVRPHMLLPEAGAIPSWIVATSIPPVLPYAGAFFVTRAKSNIDAHRVYSADGSLDRHHLRPDHLPGRYTPNLCGASASRTPIRQDAGLHHQQLLARPPPSCALYKSRQVVFFKWIKQHLRIKQLRHVGERGGRRSGLPSRSTSSSPSSRSVLDLDASLYTLLQILSVTLFEKMPIHQALA